MNKMEKAYDLKELGKRLKKRGLIEAEDAAAGIYSVVKNWYEDSAKLSATPYDDMAIVLFPQIDRVVIGEIDKIDGVEGNLEEEQE